MLYCRYLLIMTRAETQLMFQGDGYGTSLREQFTLELQLLLSSKVFSLTNENQENLLALACAAIS